MYQLGRSAVGPIRMCYSGNDECSATACNPMTPPLLPLAGRCQRLRQRLRRHAEQDQLRHGERFRYGAGVLCLCEMTLMILSVARVRGGCVAFAPESF